MRVRFSNEVPSLRIVTAKIINSLLLKRKGTVRLRSRKVWCNGSTMLNLSCFIFVPPWCNGNTTGFELVILGSIPSGGASYRALVKWISSLSSKQRVGVRSSQARPICDFSSAGSEHLPTKQGVRSSNLSSRAI
jgi:hypothetical protein